MSKKSAFIGFQASKDKPEILKIYDGVTSGNDPISDQDLITKVNPGAYVVFIPFGDISEIVDIAYEDGPDLFKVKPKQKKSGIWVGKVRKRKSQNPESYKIFYKVEGNDQVFNQDPKIRVDQ